MLSLLVAVELIAGVLFSFAGASTALAEDSSGDSVSDSVYGSVTGDVYESVFTNFITVEGDHLKDGAADFRFASLNYPGAILDPDFSKEDALRTLAAMGGQVTRTYVPPVKRYDNANASSALILGPDANGQMQFSEDGFKKLDKFLALANQYGIRVIIPFVDQWQWVGGIESYVNFRYPGTISNDAAHDDDAWKFYTDPLIISDFKQVIHYMMNRVNTYTGVAYKDDKAILAWETGNELGGYNQDKFPQAWTTEIARYIKEDEQPSQLLLDGRFAVQAESLNDPHIDIVGNHFYTGNFMDKLTADAALANGKKPYILGEFGLYTSAAPVEALYNAALQNGTDGIMIWSLRPHKEDGGFYWHDEDPGNWASYHWPGFSSGSYYGEKEIIRTVYKYAHYMAVNDVTKSTAVPAIPAPAHAPVLFDIDSVANMRWQGSVGAAGYEVQRSEDGQTWTTVASDFSDGGRAGTPAFHDETALTGVTYTYRVRGVNESGVSPWSNEVTTVAAHVITDEMSLLYKDNEKRKVYAYDHSSNLTTSSSSDNELGIGYKAYVSTANAGFLTYASPVALSRVSVTATGTGVMKWYVSSTNSNYQEIQPNKNGDEYTASSLPANTRYVKFSIPGSNAVQVDKVQLEYVYTGSGYAAPPTLVRNGFIVDSEFSGQDAERTANLQVAAGQTGTNGDAALSRSNGNSGSIVYKADGDLSSYRFTTYSNVTDEMTFLSSIDGMTYTAIHPAVSKSPTAQGWSKVIYTDFALPASTRFIKAVYPATGSGAAPALARVEIGYGVNLIPLTDKPPANVFEDGEYNYGVDANLKSGYTRNPSGDAISISLDSANKNHGSYGVKVDYAFSSQWYAGLTKALPHVDLSHFDALHAWVKPDGSANGLSFQFRTADDRVWEAKVPLTGTTGKTIELRYSDFIQPQWNKDAYPGSTMNMSDVTEFSIYVSSMDGSIAQAGAVYLDDIKMANATKLDDFEGYGGYDALIQKAFTRNTGGGSFDVALDATHKSEGGFGLKVDYNFSGPGYAGGSFNPDFLNLAGYDGFTFWLQPDGSNNELAIQFTDAEGKFWETKAVVRGSDPRLMMVPFDDFRLPSWYSSDTTARPNPAVNITAVSFYMGGSNDSNSSSGTLYIDDINGASFRTSLQTAQVTLAPSAGTVTTLPYTLHGTAVNGKFVRLKAGSQMFYAPVQQDGTWSYSTSKLANGPIDIEAAIELYNGTVVTSDHQTFAVDVANNPYQDGQGGMQQNYLLNASFDNVMDAGAWPLLPQQWTNMNASGESVTNGIVKLEAGNARTGAYGLIHWNDTPYEVTTAQQVENLPDGLYELRAWTKSKGGQEAAEMIATVEGQAPIRKNIPTGTGTWAYIKISDLEVRGGKMTVAFHSKDQGDHWIAVDDVELVRTGDIVLPYRVEAVGGMDRIGGLSATVAVSHVANTPDHAGDEVLYVQLMKGATPVSYVAVSKDIANAESITVHFDVADPNNSEYRLYAFVLDTLTKDIITLPNPLSDKLSMQ
ncbi:CIA30 family protein [Paenibacillus athensensis]|nr:carbohydrate binding domain-containing protein [Paenibacillus athensensis]MCD1259658.1 CIA30 family protein [Paenibacillus athensensis]